jgi:purine-cytosine permease-like protein
MDSTHFTPPPRRSMTDEEITNALGNAQADEAGITAAMELLETQAQLRDIEKMQFSSWVLEMERNGSPEALLAVENAHRAQKGLEPIAALPPVAPPVQPIEDVVSHLNNLYASQTAAPMESVGPVSVEEVASVFESISLADPMVEPSIDEQPVTEAPTVLQNATVPREDLLDEFDRLLAADTVVGAEDEITALEEELFEEIVDGPVSAFESISVVEQDSGIDFVQESVFEEVKLESAPKVSRRSRASSQFWAWLGLSGSVLPLGLAWFVSTIGISFSQAVVAIFLGTLASAFVISVGALAGKRSGLPTLLLSRAAFGVHANAAPASVLTVVRFFWSAAIVAALVTLSSDFFGVKSLAEYSADTNIYLYVASFVIIAAAITLAIFGGRVLFRAQQAVGLLGVAAAITLIAVTANSFSIQDLLAQPSTSWVQAFGVAVLTFSIFGLAWTSAGADFARKLSISARGAAIVGWGILALVVVPTVVASYGLALLGSAKLETPAATNSDFPLGNLLGDFAALVSPWLGYVLLASAAVSGIVVLAMSIYTANLSLHALGAKLKPAVAAPIIGVVVAAIGAAGVYYISDLWRFMADYALVASVPVAAWSGIFISDILIRRIAYHEISLSRGYGFYKSINYVNLIGWLLATALGFGFTYINQTGFAWTGFIADQLVNQEFWSTTSFGIVIAFAFASLLPVVFGIPRIKRQESEVLAIESRRDDLKDIFGLAE